ncbi:DgyrCDS8606 [Dimorphilus gyrociliatus]|nr:DgyrCDS8606 [Dimorphilus gyrociliatus]
MKAEAYLFILTVGFSAAENLARNKISYQYTTNSNNYPMYGNDDKISIDCLAPNKCSKTHGLTNEIAWWTVDLEKIYHVQKVCVLNVNFDSYTDLKDIKIYVSDLPANETNLCIASTGTVKRPVSTAFSEYKCFECLNVVTGSFVTLKLNESGDSLNLADVQVFGSFEAERSFSYFKPKMERHYHGKSCDVRYAYQATDGKYTSHAVTRCQGTVMMKRPYIRIDFEKVLKLFGIVYIPRRADISYRRTRDIYITMKNTPETYFDPDIQYCIKNFFASSFLGYFQTHILWCEKIVSGRYFTLVRDKVGDTTVVLETAEIYIYAGEDTNPVKTNVNNKKNSIIKILEDNSNVDTMVYDNIYFNPSAAYEVNLPSNIEWIISTNAIGINSVCLTVAHDKISLTTNQIYVRDMLTDNILKGETPTDFRYEQTLCVVFNFTFTKEIKILTTQGKPIAEVDLMAESFIYKGGN